jgi:rhodanese-related sulfurtransferase
VLKVMLSAIVTAMLALFWAERLGWIDTSALALPPTDPLPQLTGSVLFGAGFALASLCPGTACVAAASGVGEGLLTIGGLFVGTLVTALAWPALGRIAEVVPRPARLPDDVGLPNGTVVAMIAGLAVLLVWAVNRWSQRRGNPLETVRASRPAAFMALGLGLAAAFTGDRRFATAANLRQIAAAVAQETDHVDALELAEWIRANRPGLRIIDVREHLTETTYRIPGAEATALTALPELSVRPSDLVVLYSDGGAHAAQGWVLLRMRGVRNVFVLRDGMAAWEDEVLTPSLPASSDSTAMARYRRARELSTWFGGLPSTGIKAVPHSPVVPIPQPNRGAPERPRRRDTC